jgi:hypothetical protein
MKLFHFVCEKRLLNWLLVGYWLISGGFFKRAVSRRGGPTQGKFLRYLTMSLASVIVLNSHS